MGWIDPLGLKRRRKNGKKKKKCTQEISRGEQPSTSALAKAEEARDELLRKYGRRSATYTGGHKDGKITSGRSRNPTGCAEDDVARQLGDDANSTKAKGNRRNKETGELEVVEIPVCVRCQDKYGRGQFPEDVAYDSGGTWDVEKAL
ncbi:hypothetical protein [Caballeronia sp. LZ034LL]|uniref:hypothetical protein n=1 Tax=Caballeronia sp. LZ034LL TaxID=3038567 RepID=UPI00286B3726|nr:hypothetical protein [Caballeronia sp. LZ034LL]